MERVDSRPLRLGLLGLVLVLAALGARWAEDVTAPFLNAGEADMAHTVTLDADGGRYRIVTSGPTRPPIQQTFCEVRAGDGTVRQDRGADGVDGGRERFGVTRVMELPVAAGSAEVTCGSLRPTGGEGLGRFQVVDADGLLDRATTIVLGLGVAGILGGLVWFAVVALRTRPADPAG